MKASWSALCELAVSQAASVRAVMAIWLIKILSRRSCSNSPTNAPENGIIAVAIEKFASKRGHGYKIVKHPDCPPQYGAFAHPSCSFCFCLFAGLCWWFPVCNLKVCWGLALHQAPTAFRCFPANVRMVFLCCTTQRLNHSGTISASLYRHSRSLQMLFLLKKNKYSPDVVLWNSLE